MIKPWALQPQLAKGRAKNNLMTTFARAFMAAMGAPALLGNKLCCLLLDHCLLYPSENRSRFRQRQPEGLRSQSAAIQVRHFLDHLGLTSSDPTAFRPLLQPPIDPSPVKVVGPEPLVGTCSVKRCKSSRLRGIKGQRAWSSRSGAFCSKAPRLSISGPGCAATITELLLAGVQKMQADNKTSPQDILRAQDSLRAVVLEMKRIAVEKNEPWLNKAKFNGMLKRFASDKLRLWPFIPPPRA